MTTKESNTPKAAPTATEKFELKTAKSAFSAVQSTLSDAKKKMKRTKGAFEEHCGEVAPKKNYRGAYRTSMREFIIARREFCVAEVKFDQVRERVSNARIERAEQMSDGSARLISSHCTPSGLAEDLHQVSVDYVDGNGRKATRTVHARAIRMSFSGEERSFERVVAYRSRDNLAFIVRKHVENAEATMAAAQSAMPETRAEMVRNDENYEVGTHFGMMRMFVTARRTLSVEQPRIKAVEKKVGILSRIAA